MGLADKGFSSEPLAEMQKVIEAENCDLFDVLAYVAFALDPETRTQRADKARAEAHQHFNDKQQAFVDFVLAQYVKQGVDELDAEKLSPLLKAQVQRQARWRTSSPRTWGARLQQIRQVFVPRQSTKFQRYL
jgi:type I restriction enzyme R subunit